MLSQGACVVIDAVRAVGGTIQLTPEQFQFVRASHELPSGDKAFLARDWNGVAVLGLFDDDGQVCAVFRATDWVERAVDQVGRGET